MVTLINPNGSKETMNYSDYIFNGMKENTIMDSIATLYDMIGIDNDGGKVENDPLSTLERKDLYHAWAMEQLREYGEDFNHVLDFISGITNDEVGFSDY